MCACASFRLLRPLENRPARGSESLTQILVSPNWAIYLNWCEGIGSGERCKTAAVKSYVDERNAFAWRLLCAPSPLSAFETTQDN